MPYRLFLVSAMFLAFATLSGCAKKSPVAGAECADVYYCLNALIDARLSEYADTKPTLEKYVFLNGEEETQTIELDRTRWEAELSAFREADIDKPALRGKYLVDTLFLGTDSLTRVSYIAQDKDLRTRYLHLYYKPGETDPVYIEARLETNNVFYQSVQELELAPNDYYSIKGFQDIWLLGEDTFSVKSTFVP